MRFKGLMLATALAMATPLAPAFADPFTNGSFEDGFNGWTVSDDQLITLPGETNHFNAAGVADHNYMPTADFVQAQLTTNLEGVVTLLSQEFDILTASRLTGWAAFLGEDYIDPAGAVFPDRAGTFNDYGFVRLITGGGGDELFYSEIASASGGFAPPGSVPGGYGFTPWTFLSRTLGPGHYTLQIGVANAGDSFNDSRMVADGFQITSVPEPATWALMLSGFFGLGAMLRRRRLQPVRVRTKR